MDSWIQSALKSILRGNPICVSAAWFFDIILEFTLTSIFEIKIHEKKFLETKKISFSKTDFYKATDSYFKMIIIFEQRWLSGKVTGCHAMPR